MAQPNAEAGPSRLGPSTPVLGAEWHQPFDRQADYNNGSDMPGTDARPSAVADVNGISAGLPGGGAATIDGAGLGGVYETGSPSLAGQASTPAWTYPTTSHQQPSVPPVPPIPQAQPQVHAQAPQTIPVAAARLGNHLAIDLTDLSESDQEDSPAPTGDARTQRQAGDPSTCTNRSGVESGGLSPQVGSRGGGGQSGIQGCWSLADSIRPQSGRIGQESGPGRKQVHGTDSDAPSTSQSRSFVSGVSCASSGLDGGESSTAATLDKTAHSTNSSFNFTPNPFPSPAYTRSTHPSPHSAKTAKTTTADEDDDDDDDFTITKSTGPTRTANGSVMSAGTGFASFGTASFPAASSSGTGTGAGDAFSSFRPQPADAGFVSRPTVPSLPSASGVIGTPSRNMTMSSPAIPPSSPSTTDGTSKSTAIDVDSMPVVPVPLVNPKKPVCIGGFMSRAIMLYPQDAVIVGRQPPPHSRERWDIVNFRGVEMIKVKLKLRKAGQIPRPDEPWAAVNKDVIQVLTPGMTAYIGDLDQTVSSVLIPMLHRGLCRLEGFAMRLREDGPLFEARLNVLIFTLPSNVKYIGDTLLAHNLYLMDPMPPYDPARHNEHPEYLPAHSGGRRMYEAYLASSRPVYGSSGYNGVQDRAKQVEVQRAQVDEVFRSLDNGAELQQSDPGPWIKTELFPHQRKALTFLLQAEQDWPSLKEAYRNASKILKRKKERSIEVIEEDGTIKAEPERSLSGRDFKEDSSRSLWEGERDEKGRMRIWKNKITGEKRRCKKGERPSDAKGAILADDMGLGKTLSVVSLIAATRPAALQWGKRPLEPVEPVSEDESKSDLTAAVMKTRVFGMPEGDFGVKNGKKRTRDERDKEEAGSRRAHIVRRSKATLLVCPMSTITNWEDQLKEHWEGNVQVVNGNPASAKNEPAPTTSSGDEWDLLRVYVYHGTQRKMEPRFLAEFDIVITSYSTLANEFSKQVATCGGGGDDDTPVDTGVNSSDEAHESSRGSRGKTNPAEMSAAELAEKLRVTKKQSSRRATPSGEAWSPLQQVDWFRIVLDEAHSIKSSATVACKASCALEADRRVALTGTPIQNRIEDIWALFKFLRIHPLDDKEIFSKYITGPCKSGDQLGIARLQLVMRTCTLRRTKDSKTESGQKILNLPPRREVQMWLDLRPDEREIYDTRLAEVQHDVQEMKRRKELTKNYAHVLQHLLRLRQTCDHTDLPWAGDVEEDYDGTIMEYEVARTGIERHGLNLPRAQSVVCFLKDSDDGAVCSECGQDYSPYYPSLGIAGGIEEGSKVETVPAKAAKSKSRPILTKCLHMTCSACFKKAVWPQWPKHVKGVSRQCATCEAMLSLDTDVIEVCPPEMTDGENVNADGPADKDPSKRAVRRKYTRRAGEALSLSTKMSFLLAELMRFSKRNKYSANYDPFFEGPAGDSGPDGDGDDGEVVELDEDGAPLITKSIVFSQWTTMLDRIGDMLDEADIEYCRLDGTMTRDERARAMEQLKSSKKTEVMLVSTRAGGVGLNLTTASRAYLIDPYWNPSVEAQAIDRIHRLGQRRPVMAIKLMIKDSVEEKLAAIQKKKAALSSLSLKNMSRSELMQQKADELADLFS